MGHGLSYFSLGYKLPVTVECQTQLMAPETNLLN